ncbi:MAG: Fic family protein [Verrucomicrobia bacterium]|nr:Fic family protein [Verrucomicrobiota bacterium]MDE3047438.1 Fic family protein [Verrucomicrobiota bacterium]
MKWNWQLPQWPKFTYDSKAFLALERQFLLASGGALAMLKTLDEDKKKLFTIEILCTEGLKSSAIEGEILERESLQSSIRRHFGLVVKDKIPAKEQGMGDLLWNMYNTHEKMLTHQMLFEWHQMLMDGDSRISDIGKYRTHAEPMQIVSGRYDKHQIFFEAPPSHTVHQEMSRFIQWFNDSKEKEPALVRAAITHVYFESIHPFEDGNGRIGRALVEKALSQGLGSPTLLAVSQGIVRRKKEYYQALAACNRTLDIQNWIQFFAEVILESQAESLSLIHFLIEKSRILNELKNHLNERQEKVLLRMFAEGLKGFSGGLSAENYIKITKTSRATATRDLNDLVEKKALYKTGDLKHTRYWLNIQRKERYTNL